MHTNETTKVFPPAKDFNAEGRDHLNLRRYDQALESFDNTIKGNSVSITERFDAYVGSGNALTKLRRFNEAEEMFENARRIHKDTPTLLIDWGWLNFYQKRYWQAFADFSKALELSDEVNKQKARVGLLAASQALDADSGANEVNASKLMTEWRNNGLSDNEAVDIYQECTAIFEKLNLYPAALNNAEQRLEIDKENPQAWCNKISALKWLRRYKEAEETYRQAQAKWPTRVEIWNEMANLLYEQKRFNEAYQYYSGEALKEPDIAKIWPACWRSLRPAVLDSDEAKEWTVVSLRKLRKFDEARIKVDQALASKPDDSNFLCEKAYIYYLERNYVRAIEYFNRALNRSPYYNFAHQWLIASLRKKAGAAGSSQLAQVNFKLARQAFEEAKKRIPYETGIWEESAWLAFDQGDLEQAVADFDKAIELDPYLIEKQFSQIGILERLNRVDDALEVFRKLEERFPYDAEVGEQLCWFYLRIGEPELAADKLKEIKRHHRGNVFGVNAQGGYELYQRNYAKAEEAFREVVARVDYEPQYYINLAWALVRQIKSPGELRRSESGKPEKLIQEARDNCRKALELDPYNAKAHTCLGVIAFRHHSFLDAENHFCKSIEFNPVEGAYVELASLYCQMGRYEDATKQLETASKINPNDARVYIELGNLSVWKEDIKEAIRQCRQAIIVEPKNPEAHRALVVALMRAEKYEEAETAARRACQVLPPAARWRLHLLLAQILIYVGDKDNKERKKKDLNLYEEALRYVQEAKQINSSDADVFFNAGIAYYKLEEYRLSHKSFAECLNLNRDRFEADRSSRVVQALIKQQRELLKVNTWFGIGLALICVALLTILWVQYFGGHSRAIVPTSSINSVAASGKSETQPEPSITPTLLIAMTSVLLGLIVVAALLPNLNKLKLPGGFEAVIGEPKQPEAIISSGPRGEIGFGSSLPIISPEPR